MDGVNINLESKLDKFYVSVAPGSMPTIIALDENEEQNIFGSKVETMRPGDALCITYEDGSTIEANDLGKWICFCTKEGYQKMPKKRRVDIVELLCGKSPHSGSYKHLGSGNYSDVYKFGLPSEGLSVATKVTSYYNMQRREMQLAGWKQFKPENEDQKGRIEAMDTSLVTSWRLADTLRKNGVHVPVLYAFAISMHPSYIGSIEMMEYIPGWTLEIYMGYAKHGGFNNPNHNQELLKKALPHFSSPMDLMSQMYDDCYVLKEQAEAVEQDIGDIRPENLVITDFNTETKRFEVVLIDPIKIEYKEETK